MENIFLSNIKRSKKELAEVIYNAHAGTKIFFNNNCAEYLFIKDENSAGSTWRNKDGDVVFGDDLVDFLYSLLK